MDFKIKDLLTSFVILSVLCLTTESCDIVEAGKCLVTAAKDAFSLLPKFIKKPGPSCEKKDDIAKNLKSCLEIHYDDCAAEFQDDVKNDTKSANKTMKLIESACKNSGCKDVVKNLGNIKKCYNETGLKAIFNSDTVYDLLNANITNNNDTNLCKTAKSFEGCLQENSKTCPYLRKKFMQGVQKQDVANQVFDQCGIEITAKAAVNLATAVIVLTMASVTALLQI